MNKTLNVALALVLALSLVPAAAFADSGTEAGDDQSNSWRYDGGIPVASPETNGALEEEGDDSVSLFSRAASSEGVWKKAATGYETVWGGKKMTVTNARSFGIDVSVHQGAIDWKKVKAAGVVFAIIRCGYVGKSSGRPMTDARFLEYVKGCQDNGIKIGIYLYSYAWTVAMAQTEANHVLSLLKQAGLDPEDVAYPVFIDLEEENRAGRPSVMLTDGVGKEGNIIWQHDTSNALLAQMAEAFCSKISAAGYRPGVYANKNWFTNFLTEGFFKTGSYAKWVAQYPASGKLNHVSDYAGGHDMWQCMDKGQVDGIPEYVDVNFAYTDFSAAAGATPSRPATTTPAPAPAPAPQYTIKYVLNKGKNAKGNPATYAGTVALKNPTRSGYTFQGWYADKKFKKRVTKLTNQNATVYAKWAKNYKITYKLNGGKNHKANPKKYGGTLTLKNPSRSGYTFKGWYSNKKLTKKVTKLSMTKNRTVYVKWAKLKPGTYRVNTPGGLFIRSTPSTSGAVKGGLANGQRVRIVKIKGDWGRLSDGRGWIKLSYTKRA